MLFCACVLQATYAQNTHGDSDILVDIVVVDATGEGLPGATVKVSGKPIPVLTAMDGKVKLWVRKGEKNHRLVFGHAASRARCEQAYIRHHHAKQ